MKFLIKNIQTAAHINFSGKFVGDEYKVVPVAEINTMMNVHRNIEDFQWSNNFRVPDTWRLTKSDEQILDSLKTRMIPDEYFVIGHNAEIGFFPYVNHKTEKGKIIFYASNIVNTNTDTPNYKISCHNDMSADARKIGNFSSLFPDLYPCSVDTSIPVAKNNFEIKTIKLSCGVIAYLEASRDIPANTLCGVAYGIKYWQGMLRRENIRQCYLTPRGETIKDEAVIRLLNESRGKSFIEAMKLDDEYALQVSIQSLPTGPSLFGKSANKSPSVKPSNQSIISMVM